MLPALVPLASLARCRIFPIPGRTSAPGPVSHFSVRGLPTGTSRMPWNPIFLCEFRSARISENSGFARSSFDVTIKKARKRDRQPRRAAQGFPIFFRSRHAFHLNHVPFLAPIPQLQTRKGRTRDITCGCAIWQPRCDEGVCMMEGVAATKKSLSRDGWL